jgi:uncharacterized protein
MAEDSGKSLMDPGIAQREPPPTVAFWDESARPPPWGYFGSVVWTLLAFGLGSIAGMIFYVVMIGLEQTVALSQKINIDPSVRFDGVLLAYVYVASSIVQIAVFVFAIRLKRWEVTEYLALIAPAARAIFPALALVAALVLITDGALAFFGKNPVPEFQIVSYRTAKAAGLLPLLFAVIVLIAPLAEEIMFRGFLYRGFVRRPNHAPYAILVISLVFAAIHQQYDWFGLTQVFLMALLFGWVRWWSGSTILTVLMHVLANFIAMVETVIYMEWWRT